MSIPPRLVLGSLLLSLCASALARDEPLSDFERFRSYPYLERSYREARKNNWAEVERLMRHLLTLVPNSSDARDLLVESLTHQGRYAEAVQLLSGQADQRAALLDLRLAWIEKAPPPAAQVEGWLQQSTRDDRIRLWQAYSSGLARRDGAAAALAWLQQLTSAGDDEQLRLACSNWAERLQDWEAVVAQLAPLAAQHQLGAEGWRRLANAYVQRFDAKPLEQLLQQSPNATAGSDLRRAMVDRAIALGRTEQAQHWLQALPERDLSAADLQRLWELGRQTGNSALVQRLSGELQRPCLETAEWLSQHDRDAALRQLSGCRADADPQRWLVLAQRLQASDLLQSQRLPEPWDSARRERLLEVWRTQGLYRQAADWLAAQPQSPDIVKKRAELAQSTGRLGEAAALWERHYRLNGSLASLDQLSYLLLQAGQRQRAQLLLEQAYDAHDGRLSGVLWQRLADLYSGASGTTPSQQQRMARLLGRVDPTTREQLLGRLAQAGRCDIVRQAVDSEPQDVGQLRVLGNCAMAERPGEAVVYLQRAVGLGDKAGRLLLAYALEAAGDSAEALDIWRSVPLAQLDDDARLAACRSALAIGAVAEAERYWQQSSKRGSDDWALGAAIAEARSDLPMAIQRQRQALQQGARAEHFYAAAITAQKAGDLRQSTDWLAEAARLAPNQARYGADYGMRLASASSSAERQRALPYLQRAVVDFPEDFRLAETLAWRYDAAGDSAAARRELRRAIDLEQNPLGAGGEEGSLEARRYRQRRSHEALSRRDSLTLASTWSPAGVTSNDNLRPGGGTVRRANAQNVQIAVWDHALGEEPSRAGRSLSIYGRVLFGGRGRSDYAQSAAAGVGLRYKPFGNANLNLYGELYKQSQFDQPSNHSLGLGELLNPGKLWDQLSDYARNGQVSTDYLLRATASVFDQGKFRADWRVDERHWGERSLYLDAAWWAKSGNHQWLSRYQQGHTWKLSSSSAQTLMPYGFVEFSSQDPSNVWRQDLRTGVGLRWQWWAAEDRYNAYRSRLSVRTEYQQSLEGNLYEGGNGMLLGVEWNF